MIRKTLSRSPLRFLIIACLAVPLLSACETPEDRALADAEHCINSANASNVDQCLAKVSGMQSAGAYLVRCSGHFIAQNFSESTLATAFKNIKAGGSTSGATPTTFALSYLVFNETIPLHTVAVSKNDCELSGAKSLIRILNLVEIATTAVSIGGGGAAATNGFAGGDTASIKTDLTNLASTAQGQVTLGNMAIEVRNNFCVNNSSFGDSDICAKMNQAYQAGSGNPQTIGQQLALLLQ